MYYAQRLAEMIRCRTVSKKDSFAPAEFMKLRAVIETLFPLVNEKAERTILGDDAYLYQLPGKDTSRNVMVMSHHDVVDATGRRTPSAASSGTASSGGGARSIRKRRCLRS